MKKFICVTGKIASGKSTAMKMLHHRTFTTNGIPHYTNMKFVDLDFICKNVYNDALLEHPILEQGIELKSFFDSVFNGEFPTSKAIIDNIFTNTNLYETYCSFFESYMVEYLDNLPDAIYLIEAAAIFSYPKLYEKMNHVIAIKNDANRTTNLKKRNVGNSNIMDSIYSNYSRKYCLDTKISYIELIRGTYMELRSKVEFELVKVIASIYADSSYFDGIADIIDIIEHHTAWHGESPYHNRMHAIGVFTDLVLTGKYTPTRGYAAIYHDWVYHPQAIDNEYRSAQIALKELSHKPELADSVAHLIQSTTYKEINEENFDFFLSDVSHWNKTDNEIIEAEKLVFQEYQYVDFDTYKSTRIKILQSFIDNPNLYGMPMTYVKGILTAIAWLNSYEPKIGWLCGSFNPFTIGHMDLLTRADKMFDKVVLVQAKNPSKRDDAKSIKDYNQLKSYEKYTGITNLVELIQSVSYKPVLIRGIRTPQDLVDNELWIQQINEFVDVDLVNIISKPKLNHISSLFVRSCDTIGLDSNRFIIS